MEYKSNKAFTLLEVLITVAILSTAIVFVFRSFTASLSSVKFSQNITLACYLAKSKLWEIEQYYKNNLELPASGEETVQNKKFNWSYEITVSETSNLEQLKLTISWQENIREAPYTIEFLTYLLPKAK